MNWLRKSAWIALPLVVSGCLVQTENSTSSDAPFAGGSAEFVAARAVMSQSCNGCHNYHTQSETELKAAGLVIAADPENSKLFYRLVGSSGVQGPKDMPQGGSLSSSDLEAVFTWIENMTP